MATSGAASGGSLGVAGSAAVAGSAGLGGVAGLGTAGGGGTSGPGGSAGFGASGGMGGVIIQPPTCTGEIPTVTNANGFDATSAQAGQWVVNNAAGTYAGAAAIHPGAMLAGDSKSFSFDCGGGPHDQLRFYLKAAGSGTRQLRFKVDGASREVFVGDGYWREQVINVSSGVHSYEFTATTTQGTESPFQLDSFQCLKRAPCLGPNGNVTFDLGFIPPEAVNDAGQWFVGNTQGVHQGEAAVSAPNLLAGDKKSFSFDCGGAQHTQLSFYLKAAGSGTRQLTFEVDGKPRDVFVGDGYWRQQVIDVPRGPHTYTFSATSSQDTGSPFQLDTFLCRNVAPTLGSNGNVTFDSGFIPPEAVNNAGQWFVGNTQGVHEGEAAVSAPNLLAGDKKSFSFDCGAAEHTQLSFYLKAAGSGTRQLSFEVDGKLREVFVGDGYWRQQIIDVPKGVHVYTFSATTTQDTGSPFQLDTFLCRNVTPVLGANGNVTFDLGFIPPEAANNGGEWFVGNSQGTHQGDAAISAPNMLAGDKKTFTFTCGGAEHTQLSFYLKAAGSGTRQLAFEVDGKLREVFVGDGYWRQQVIDVAKGVHTYTFSATTTQDTGSPFQLDTFLCRNVAPAPGANGNVTFDLGFIPPEALSNGGEWFVGNTQGVHQGEAAISAPNMLAGDKKSFTFNCAGAQLSFYLKAAGSGSRKLTLTVDGNAPITYVGDGYWRQQIVSSLPGNHSYVFAATTTENTASPFQLDTFVCGSP